MTEDRFQLERLRMVETQLQARGIHDEATLQAFRTVPRHRFVPEGQRHQAYSDAPLPIGQGQTISQPFIIAFMLQALRVRPGDKALEIGTGSGYQTALLLEMGAKVYTVERIALLQERAKEALEGLGYTGVNYKVGDGSLGWPEEAPYDAITVGASAPQPPPSLVAQLDEDGRMILPVGGTYHQQLTLIEKETGKTRERSLGGCVFVRLIGKEAWPGE